MNSEQTFIGVSEVTPVILTSDQVTKIIPALLEVNEEIKGKVMQ
jgi:hypothetical protein